MSQWLRFFAGPGTSPSSGDSDVHEHFDSLPVSYSFTTYGYNSSDTYFGFQIAQWPFDYNFLFGANLDKVIRVQGEITQLAGAKAGQKMIVNFNILRSDMLLSNLWYALCPDIHNVGSVNQLQASFTVSVAADLVPPCENIPDGQAQLCIIGRKADGSAYAQKFPFNFSGGFRRIELDVSSLASSGIPDYNGIVALESFIFRASKGFVNGTVRILERYTAPAGSFVQYPYIHDISINSGQKQVKFSRPHYLVYLDTSAVLPLPISFSFKILLELDFDALPECLPDVEPETEEQTGSILDELVITEPFQPPPDQPLIPEAPEYPPDILITDGGAGFSGGGGNIDWQTILGIILDAIGGPSAPPDGMCECEKYLADVLAGRLNYLQKTLDTRLSQFITSEQVTGRKLIEAIQSLHLTIAAGIEQNKPSNQAAVLDEVLKKYFQTTEDEPRGLADVIAQKDCAPVQFIHVDTNSCYYRHLMPSPGEETP